VVKWTVRMPSALVGARVRVPVRYFQDSADRDSAGGDWNRRRASRNQSLRCRVIRSRSEGIEPGGWDRPLAIAGVHFRQARMQYKSPLLQSLQSNLRLQHLSRRTEAAYVYWTKRFVRFCGLRHPSDLGPAEVRRFLTHLVVDRHLSGRPPSSRRPARCCSSTATCSAARSRH
jgi:hypothetical protein